MSNIYDLIIIGSGPAGLTAGIYAERAQLHTLIIEKNGMSGGQIINTYEVDNYPGIPGISGVDLAIKFREHCEQLGAKFMDGDVTSFSIEGDQKLVTLDSGETYTAKAVIIAAGANVKKLGAKGEEEYMGLGVSYCATCDGAFFKGRTTLVVGGGDVAVEDAIFLSRLCEKVYLVHRRDTLRAAKRLVSKLEECSNVEFIPDCVVEEIGGSDVVESVRIRNKKTGEEKTLDVNGVFVAVGMTPASEVYASVVETDDGGYIISDETCHTNVAGVFAAGDIRTKQLKQIITAASDGANAITSVEKYLNTLG